MFLEEFNQEQYFQTLRDEGFEDGFEDGFEEGIRGMIKVLCEIGKSKEEITLKVIEQRPQSPDIARKLVEKYWER